jgi:DNA-binding GntR family transcriptional regulator
MRKRSTIKIDDREITVKELTVKDVLEIFEAGGDLEKMDLFELVKVHLPKAVDLTIDDMKSMAPSDLVTVYEAWREVNSAFFRIAQAVGLGAILKELAAAMQKDFMTLFFASLKRDTATYGVTDGEPS